MIRGNSSMSFMFTTALTLFRNAACASSVRNEGDSENKEETPALRRSKNIDLSDHKNRSLFGWIKLRFE